MSELPSFEDACAEPCRFVGDLAARDEAWQRANSLVDDDEDDEPGMTAAERDMWYA